MQAGAVQIRLVADIMDLQSKMQKAQSIVDNAAGSISKALGAAFAGFSAASFVTKLIAWCSRGMAVWLAGCFVFIVFTPNLRKVFKRQPLWAGQHVVKLDRGQYQCSDG